jgi:hypothetical protein
MRQKPPDLSDDLRKGIALLRQHPEAIPNAMRAAARALSSAADALERALRAWSDRTGETRPSSIGRRRKI